LSIAVWIHFHQHKIGLYHVNRDASQPLCFSCCR
jgi:hypothetical protein